MRSIDDWRPPIGASRHKAPEVGDVIAWDFCAWRVSHISGKAETDENGYDKRMTLSLLHGTTPRKINSRNECAIAYDSRRWRPEVYKEGRVWICSCCNNPAPCRITLAEEESTRSAKEFDKRLARMGPGLCYGCGEVITKRQERITYPGEHADFPGRSGPTFHLRQKCYGERRAYAARAGLHEDGGLLPAACKGTIIRHGDGTYECTAIPECEGIRAAHSCYTVCDCCTGQFGCTPQATDVRRERSG